MAQIFDEAGNAIPFACGNSRFQTNRNKGKQHGTCPTRGSVFREPLILTDDDCSLWLEHVTDIENEMEVLWLMWYFPDGRPMIPMSGVFNKEELSSMVGKLTEFIP